MREQEPRQTISRRSGYSSIPNQAMSDRRISIEARGLLSLLMTFREGWVFRNSHLRQTCEVGRDKFQRMLKELKDVGYVKIASIHDEKTGRFLGTNWEICDVPDHRVPENPASGKSGPLRDNNYKGRSEFDVIDTSDLFS